MADLFELKNCRRRGGGRVAACTASPARPSGEDSQADGLRGADLDALALVKWATAYGGIRLRVAELKPIDAWQLDGQHYFTFALTQANGALGDSGTSVALFVMNGDATPASALVLTPSVEGTQVDLQDLRNPGGRLKVDLDPAVASRGRDRALVQTA